MKKKTIVIGLVVAAVLVLGLVGVVSATAVTMRYMDKVPALHGLVDFFGGEGPHGKGPRGEEMRGRMQEVMIDALAEATGLSVDEINQRMEEGETLHEIAESAGVEGEELAALMEEALDVALVQAVEDGELTQEQADQIKEHMEERFENRPHREGPHSEELRGRMREAMIDALAEATGLGVDEINQRMEDGETLHEIAESAGVEDEELATLMEEALDAALQQAVEDGELTQEQADQIKEHMEERFEDGFSRMPFGGMGGGHGKHGGGMFGKGHGGFGGCFNSTAGE
jgi:uncharacterized protein YidB (DUF937 family)